jgi:hypothetical protein
VSVAGDFAPALTRHWFHRLVAWKTLPPKRFFRTLRLSVSRPGAPPPFPYLFLPHHVCHILCPYYNQLPCHFNEIISHGRNSPYVIGFFYFFLQYIAGIGWLGRNTTVKNIIHIFPR